MNVDSFILVLVALMGLLVLGIYLAYLVGRAAQRKGRSFEAWFAIAIFFLIPAAIIVAVMQDDPDASARALNQTKRCPACAETVLLEARRCKHCGEDLTVST